MGVLEYAQQELDVMGMTADNPEEMNREMRKNILTICATFAQQGHSGFSASYTLEILSKLLRFEPLTPLTGEDSEWNDISGMGGDNTVFQNNRCSHVFKRRDGVAYDINGKIFTDGKGSFTSGDSVVEITFPYTPKTEHVNV